MQKKYGGLAAALLCVVLFMTGCDRERAVYSSGLTEETAVSVQTESSFVQSVETENRISAGVEILDESLREAVSQAGYGSTGNVQSDAEEAESVFEQTDGYVYVCGAVKKPGVYPVTSDMRIFEAIELAGGFAEEADTQWLNQAEPVQDGQKLYVYTLEETSQIQSEMAAAGQSVTMADLYSSGGQPGGLSGGDASSSSSSGSLSDGLVNINTADRETLMTLPGIGEAKADAVIQYRSDHGSFGSIEEIQNVPGIKNAVFLKIKDRITVGS